MAYSASIILEANDIGFFDVEVMTYADSEQEAKEAAEAVLLRMTNGKNGIVQAGPESRTDRGVLTRMLQHKGYCRFMSRDEPGEMTYRTPVAA